MAATWPEAEDPGPSGRMSGRARQALDRRNRTALFGGLDLGPEEKKDPRDREPEAVLRAIAQAQAAQQAPPSAHEQAEHKRAYARFLRDLAARGEGPRKHVREAERLEAEAVQLEVQAELEAG